MPNQQTEPITEISLEGFQIVSSKMFRQNARFSSPTCTLRNGSILFNKASIIALNQCERIRIEINPKNKCMLLIPTTIKDIDSIKWTKGIKEAYAKKMECKLFTTQLYDIWKLDKSLAYRAIGRIVSADRKVMLFFDFGKAEKIDNKEMVK